MSPELKEITNFSCKHDNFNVLPKHTDKKIKNKKLRHEDRWLSRICRAWRRRLTGSGAHRLPSPGKLQLDVTISPQSQAGEYSSGIGEGMPTERSVKIPQSGAPSDPSSLKMIFFIPYLYVRRRPPIGLLKQAWVTAFPPSDDWWSFPQCDWQLDPL